MKWRFKPTFWATFFALPALLVLLALGTWQVQRLEWKLNLIDQMATRMAAPAIPLATLDGDPQWRKVEVRGEFDHGRELYLHAIVDGAAGVKVITPLIQSDGDAVLVIRGFVPPERKERGLRLAGLVSGPQTIEGLVRPPSASNWLTPPNDAEGNYWFTLDKDAMASAMGLTPSMVSPHIIEAGPAPNPGGWPRGMAYEVKLKNDHLGYAITWYGLALTLVGVYIAYHIRRV